MGWYAVLLIVMATGLAALTWVTRDHLLRKLQSEPVRTAALLAGNLFAVGACLYAAGLCLQARRGTREHMQCTAAGEGEGL